MKIDIPFAALRMVGLAKPVTTRGISHHRTALNIGAEKGSMFLAFHNYRALACAKWHAPEAVSGNFEFSYENVGELVKLVGERKVGPDAVLYSDNNMLTWGENTLFMPTAHRVTKWRQAMDYLSRPVADIKVNPTTLKRFLSVFAVTEATDPDNGPYIKLGLPPASNAPDAVIVRPHDSNGVTVFGAFMPAKADTDWRYDGWESVYEKYKTHVVDSGLSGTPTVDILKSALKLMSASQLAALKKELGCEND